MHYLLIKCKLIYIKNVITGKRILFFENGLPVYIDRSGHVICNLSEQDCYGVKKRSSFKIGGFILKVGEFVGDLMRATHRP